MNITSGVALLFLTFLCSNKASCSKVKFSFLLLIHPTNTVSVKIRETTYKSKSHLLLLVSLRLLKLIKCWMQWSENIRSGGLTTQNPPLCTGRSPTSGNYTDLWPWHIEHLLSVFGRFSSFPWCTLPPAMNNSLQTLQRLLFYMF